MAPTELAVRLDATTGPYGTSDDSIRLEARTSGQSHTDVTLMYGYRQGVLTGAAMDLYLATVGRGKVGFSTASSGPGGTELIGGTRGLLERNLMRHFLAIDAAASTPVVKSDADYERRLRAWFSATERHPRQLHEVDLDTYLALKRPLRETGVPPRDAREVGDISRRVASLISGSTARARVGRYEPVPDPLERCTAEVLLEA
jgi:hypothetical protein